MIRTRLQGDVPFFPSMLNNWKVEVCLKEDVDKAIAEKDEQLRHSNYKRCLAMARCCKINRILAADYRIPREKWELYDKWHRHWEALAEKFKPYKEAK